MRKLLAALLLFGLGVVVGTMGSDDTLLQEAQQQASQSYDQGVTDATRRLQGVAIQVGCATWEPGASPHEPQRFVWKQAQIKDIAEAEDTLQLIPAFWQPDPGHAPYRVLLPVRNLRGNLAEIMVPTAG